MSAVKDMIADLSAELGLGGDEAIALIEEWSRWPMVEPARVESTSAEEPPPE